MRRVNTMKIQLTNEEIEAVKDSIKHWEKDIRDRFKKGDSIIGTSTPFIWSSDSSIVMMYEENCALCLLVKWKNSSGYKFCMNCAYFKKYRITCTDLKKGKWNKFRDNPTLKNCNKMIEALENILE